MSTSPEARAEGLILRGLGHRLYLPKLPPLNQRECQQHPTGISEDN